MPKTAPPPEVTAQARAAARARWGPPRVVRLDQVDPDTANLIRALLRMREAAARAEAAGAREATDG